ncbi:Serine/threonine protein kinase-related domain protein [Candidatus Magnetomorum sp. HK-1]|nr:Serine/threonine protein kinase-related domain protein [Candidatus Magnetomorum sp. HK-1]
MNELRNLEYLFRDYKIFIDVCSIMHNSSEKFFNNIKPLLIESNNHIIIPMIVVKELEKNVNSEDDKTKENAKKGFKILSSFATERLIEVQGDENDTVIERLFQELFTKFRDSYNMCLITQDHTLAKNLFNFVNIKPDNNESGYYIQLLYIDNYSNLQNWDVRFKELEKHSNNERPQRPKSIKNNVNSYTKPFRLYDKPINEEDKLLSATIPAEGDIVITDKLGKVKLTDIIDSGGEGVIYKTEIEDIVCKIYNKDKLTTLKEKKLKRMASKNVRIKGVCWPIDIAYNTKNNFVGYFMEQASGHSLQKSVFIKPLLEKKFPEWNRTDLITLVITILNKIKRLHKLNVIMGDINPNNILFKDPKTVYFVDVDSYQIENFPCPVGTVMFSAPEIQGSSFNTFLRKQEHEIFAISTLIFMILFPGRSPYGHQGGGSLADNIKKMNFPYVKEEGEIDKKPFGPWRYIWSHLHGGLKWGFASTFKRGERLSLNEWIKLLSKYRKDLKEKKFGDDDSLKIFPNTYFSFRKEDEVEVSCLDCGKKEFVPKRILDTLKYGHRCSKHRELRKLKKAREEVKKYQLICDKCKLSISVSKHIYERNRNSKYICNECRKRIDLKCPDCINTFTMPQWLVRDLMSKGINIRCDKCKSKPYKRRPKPNKIQSHPKNTVNFSPTIFVLIILALIYIISLFISM